MASFRDLYKQFRRQIRKLGREDTLRVIWGYSLFLQIEGFNFPNDVEAGKQFIESEYPPAIVGEWELELLTKEVLIHGQKTIEGAATFRQWSTMARTLKLLRDFENQLAKKYHSPENFQIEILRIANRQFRWQSNRPNAAGLMRFYLVFGDPEINESCKRITGLSVSDILLCGLALMGVFQKVPNTKGIVEGELSKFLSESTIKRFLLLTSRGAEEISALLREQQHFDERFPYAYNCIREFPLIRFYETREFVVCPIPTLLYWRATSGLYYDLRADPGFQKAFGSSFEAYVRKVAVRARTTSRYQVVGEFAYVPKKRRKRSADLFLTDGENTLFIECKAKRLTWASKEGLNDTSALQKDLGYLSQAIVQSYKTASDFQKGQYGTHGAGLGKKFTRSLLPLKIGTWLAHGSQACWKRRFPGFWWRQTCREPFPQICPTPPWRAKIWKQWSSWLTGTE